MALLQGAVYTADSGQQTTDNGSCMSTWYVHDSTLWGVCIGHDGLSKFVKRQDRF